MTARQQAALAFVRALYEDGTLGPQTPKFEIPSRAGSALTADLLAMLGSEIRSRFADALQGIVNAVRGR